MHCEKIVMIFVDSLPYTKALRMNSLTKFNITSFKTGFGYSINILPMLLNTAYPDDLGYLNEWSYAPDSKFKRFKTILQLLSRLRISYYSDRFLHKLLSKITPIANIPFHLLPFFESKLPDIYCGEALTNFKKITWKLFKQNRDAQVYSVAKKALSSHDNLFVTFTDLDHVGHAYGLSSPEYSSKFNEIDKYVNTLSRPIINAGGKVIVFSDHGMANVTKSINISIEKAIGKAGKKSYIYFIDSTLLRIWIFDERLRSKIIHYLQRIPDGQILTEKQRQKYGITSRKFGDIIFILNEGIVFSPNFFGKKVPKAMHGYLPEIKSQHAVFASSDLKIDNIRNHNDIYIFLRKVSL